MSGNPNAIWPNVCASLLSALLLCTASPAGGAGFCQTSADAGFAACLAGISNDYWVAVVKCMNLAAAPARETCRELAGEERGDGRDGCEAQRRSRAAVCEDLSGGRYHPTIDPARFVSGVTNPFFPLQAGRTLVYQGTTPEGTERVEVTVTGDTKVILGVTCTVVRDTVSVGGVVVEDTLDWYAQDLAGNVWYFGEESRNYENGELVSLEGSWLAGRDGASPGIVMKANPEDGVLYRQEYLVSEAEDVARVVALGRTAEVLAGTFTGCLVTRDFSPLEPEVAEHKFYAPGVGLVLELQVKGGSDRLELVEIIGP